MERYLIPSVNHACQIFRTLANAPEGGLEATVTFAPDEERG